MAKKPGIIKKALTKQEFEELIKVSKDPFFFSTFIYVIHALRGRVKFVLYPFQKSVLWQFITRRFNIILKFRQAGITELISMFCLWLAMYHREKTIVIISIKDRVAKKVLRKIKYMYRNLPEHLKVEIINGRKGEFGTAMDIEFANGSIISSIPTTEDAGRSESVSLAVFDEAAIMRWANQIWAAMFPTLSTGGSAIVNSCVTGDTQIIGKHGNFRIDTICPKEFGKQDISALGIKVLTHTGKWQRVIGSVNKGKLRTWKIKDEFGNILKCTPNHKLFTTDGWKSVREIIKENFNAIIYDPGLGEIQNPPITIPPLEELIRPIKGFPNYRVSNLGKIYIVQKDGTLKIKPSSINNRGYYSTRLWHNCKKKTKALSHVVVEAFIGEIPEDYIVDHIDCNPEHDYVTNLQILTVSENGKRAALYSRAMKLGSKIGKGFPNIQLIGKIREKAHKLPDTIIEECYKELGITVTRTFVCRILSGRRTQSVQISKIKVIKKFTTNIYDICVENDESYITNSNYVNHNTPFGIGNWFHKMWVTACAGGNTFNPIRLKWQMHPERDIDWYNEMRAALGDRRTAQEIDGDFLSSGNSVFDLADIRAIEEELDQYKIVRRDENGKLLIFKEPEPNNTYSIGSDVSTGRAQDYSSFTLYDKHGEECAVFKKKVPPRKLADILMKYGKRYNYASIAPESNDIGLAVTSLIQDAGYRNLYYTKALLKKAGERKPKEEDIPGWLTTKRNRPLIIAGLEEDIRNSNVITKDPFFVQEAYTFIYDESNRPVAMGKGKRHSTDHDEELSDGGYSDDAIMGKAIANHIRKGKGRGPIILPR